MQPLRIYTFKHKFSSTIKPINLEIIGDINKAWRILANYVININNWKYDNNY